MKFISALITRLFGCRHKLMSRPFTQERETYRTCITCGARRRFNPEKWEMTGKFYYRSERRNV